jgi:hypothetical protein
MGDMLTDSKGEAVGDFIGRFQIGTFIVAPPSSAPAPVVLSHAAANPPTALPSRSLVRLAGAETPLNSTHNAGVQILNISNFPILKGPPLTCTADRAARQCPTMARAVELGYADFSPSRGRRRRTG